MCNRRSDLNCRTQIDRWIRYRYSENDKSVTEDIRGVDFLHSMSRVFSSHTCCTDLNDTCQTAQTDVLIVKLSIGPRRTSLSAWVSCCSRSINTASSTAT